MSILIDGRGSLASNNPMISSDLDCDVFESGTSSPPPSIQLSSIRNIESESVHVYRSNEPANYLDESVGGIAWKENFASVFDRALFDFQEKIFSAIPLRLLLLINTCCYFICTFYCLICACNTSFWQSFLINAVVLFPANCSINYSLIYLNFFYSTSPVDIFGNSFNFSRIINIQDLITASRPRTLRDLLHHTIPLKGNPLRYFFDDMGHSLSPTDGLETLCALGTVGVACLAFASAVYTVVITWLINSCVSGVFLAWNTFHFFVLGMVVSLLGRVVTLLMLRIKTQEISPEKYFELLQTLHDASVIVGRPISVLLTLFTVTFLFTIINGFLDVVPISVIALSISCDFFFIAYLTSMVSLLNAAGRTYVNCLCLQGVMPPHALLVDEHSPGMHVVALRLFSGVRLNFSLLARVLLSFAAVIVSYLVNYALTHGAEK